jgi:tripartite-type tricarboxylate transporter receptor subunit TctC
MQHVPYKGAGPAANDLLGGQIFSMVDITAGSMKYIQADLLRPRAVIFSPYSIGEVRTQSVV